VSKKLNQNIEAYMDTVEDRIFNDEYFSKWRGTFEVKKTYVKKDNADIKCDLDVRLQHWPEAVAVKIYKHKALAVLPSCHDENITATYLKKDPVPSKFWKNTFYFSHRTDLDDARYILREGNEMRVEDINTCIKMLHEFIEEIESITNL
jgi:hypothetical protein